MKTFRFDNGVTAGKTLTVAELKAELYKYPDDMPVMVTWEGADTAVIPNNSNISPVHKGNIDDEEDCLIIDVEAY